jgi:hypothetical protein
MRNENAPHVSSHDRRCPGLVPDSERIAFRSYRTGERFLIPEQLGGERRIHVVQNWVAAFWKSEGQSSQRRIVGRERYGPGSCKFPDADR